jgi:hypothetical protein
MWIYTSPYWTIDDNSISENKTYSSEKIVDLLGDKTSKITDGQDDNIVLRDTDWFLKSSDKKVTDFAPITHSHPASQFNIDTTNFGWVLDWTITNVQLLADFIDDNILLWAEIYIDSWIPSSLVGKTGDLYIDNSNWDVYRKTDLGWWTPELNIKWPQWVKGDTWDTWPQWLQWTPWINWVDWTDWVGIDNITRTSGDGSPGTTDIYTITYTDSTQTTFQVHNWANWTWSGDFMADGTVPITWDLNFNWNSAIGVDSIQLDTTPSVWAPAEWELKWNADEGTADLWMPGGNVKLSLGQEMYVPRRCKNETWVTIPNWYVVYINWVSGQTPTIIWADASLEATSSKTIGITTEEIINNQSWYVTTYWIVRWLNTLAYPVWTPLWLSTTAGQYTDVRPSAPDHAVFLWYVFRQHATEWEIYVTILNGYEFEELHDVLITNRATSDIAIYDTDKWVNTDVMTQDQLTGFADNTNITVTYSHTNRTTTLTHPSWTITYYYRWVKKTLTSPWISDAHADVSANYFLYSVDGTNFAWSTTPWNFRDLMVSYVRFVSGSSTTSFALREVHGLLDVKAHQILHSQIGTHRVSGGILTAWTYTENTATNVATTPWFDSAIIRDEDIDSTIPAWIEWSYTQMYIGASNTATFVKWASYPFTETGSFLQVNNIATGAMTNWINNRWYNVYQILIPATADSESQSFRMIMLQPQAAHTSLANALAEDVRSLVLWDFENLATEWVIYARITYVTSSWDANAGKCRIATGWVTYIVGNRWSQTSVSGFNPTDHQVLDNIEWTTSWHTDWADSVATFWASWEATSKLLSEFVQTTGDQTIAWNKTFTWTLIGWNSKISLRDGNIENNATDANAQIAVSYYWYNISTTRFRNFWIYDWKTNPLWFFDWVNWRVWILTTTPAASSALDITSTTKGFLPPRMTTAQRDAISSPAEWLIVYNTTTDKLNTYSWSAWEEVWWSIVTDTIVISRDNTLSAWAVQYNHWLWKTPKLIQFELVDATNYWSSWDYDWWWHTCVYPTGTPWASSTTSYCVRTKASWSAFQTATVTAMTTTTFDLTWAKTWSPTWTAVIKVSLFW